MRGATVVVAMLGIACGPRPRGPSDAPRAPADGSAAGAASASTDPAAPGAAPLMIAGFAVWNGPRDALSPTARAYLERLERVQRAYATAPRPPVTFTADRVAFERWYEATLRPWSAPLASDTARLVAEHPRLPDESPAERRFHIVLEVIEGYTSASYLGELVDGPPGYAGCPEDVADDLAYVLTELVRDGERCVVEFGADPGGSATARECAAGVAWAKAQLATAAPPPPDKCLEDMPRPGD